jgi:hypothetical protein
MKLVAGSKVRDPWNKAGEKCPQTYQQGGTKRVRWKNSVLELNGAGCREEKWEGPSGVVLSQPTAAWWDFTSWKYLPWDVQAALHWPAPSQNKACCDTISVR